MEKEKRGGKPWKPKEPMKTNQNDPRHGALLLSILVLVLILIEATAHGPVYEQVVEPIATLFGLPLLFCFVWIAYTPDKQV